VCAIATVNAEHSSSSAVSRITRTTQSAVTATRVYLANNTTADERSVSAVFNDAYKLMTNCSIEPRIPTRDLEIRVADARQQHAHHRLINVIGLAYIFNCEPFFIDAEGKHFRKSYFACTRSVV
jgi:hypothetical protein